MCVRNREPVRPGAWARHSWPSGVADVAGRYGVPVIAFAGTLGRGADYLVGRGFEAVVPIMPGPGTLADALADGPNNLERAAATAMRLIKLGAAG